MKTLSISRILGIWDELHQAFNNEHGFGGNTAEIYAYRLSDRDSSYNPNGDYNNPIMGDDFRKTDQNAKVNLSDICEEFMKRHDCKIHIDTPDGWKAPEEYVIDSWILNHRVHVRVERGS